jgi:DnaJ domain
MSLKSSTLLLRKGVATFTSKSANRRKGHSVSTNYFEILGVTKDCGNESIKRAFYQRAKQLHPDVNKRISLQEANRQFIELKSAYDTLTDPKARLLYLSQLDRRYRTDPVQKSDTDRHTYTHPIDDECDEFYQCRKPEGSYYRLKRRKSIVPLAIDSWQMFREDLDHALSKAYNGPHFTPTLENSFPDAFEAEERTKVCSSSASEVDIMQIVSGRQLLGGVIYDTNRALSSLDSIGIETARLELRWHGAVCARATRTSPQVGGHGHEKGVEYSIDFEVKNEDISYCSSSFMNANHNGFSSGTTDRGDGFRLIARLKCVRSPESRRLRTVLTDAAGCETHAIIRYG